jgi:hypothetical protein
MRPFCHFFIFTTRGKRFLSSQLAENGAIRLRLVPPVAARETRWLAAASVRRRNVAFDQGDLIGRISDQMGDCLLGAVFLKMTEVAHIFVPLFSLAWIMY